MSRRAGIDVGGTKCLAVVIDDTGTIVEQARLPTPHGPAELIGVLADLADSLGRFDSLGVGAPGLVTRTGVLRAAPNLSDVAELPLGRLLSERLGMVVAVENDNTAAAFAESRLGVGVGVDEMTYVGLGTGIGGAFVLGGELQRGSEGFSGEIGHMVIEVDGVRCVCGRSGCWERYASGSGLARLAREAAIAGDLASVVQRAGGDRLAVRGEDVMHAARTGDADAVKVVDRFARWVALGLVNLVNLLDPSLVVLGGGLVEASDVLMPPVRAHAAELLYSSQHRPHPRIEPAHLGERAAAIGAALLGADVADVEGSR